MSKKGQYRGILTGKKFMHKIRLRLYIWSEDKVFFVYAPALDLTGYGNTETEAKDSFTHILQETVSYMENKDTLFDELERLGWTTNRAKRRVKAPDIKEMKEDNEEFRIISSKPNVKTINESLELAI
ncbi:MAG: hypothetical protein ACT6QS_15455 [Flavobacteriales bacterium]